MRKLGLCLQEKKLDLLYVYINQKIPKYKEGIMKAKLGDILVFERDGMEITGRVMKNYENSTLVEVVTVIGGDFPYERTVVNHKKYRLCTNDTE